MGMVNTQQVGIYIFGVYTSVYTSVFTCYFTEQKFFLCDIYIFIETEILLMSKIID